MNAIFQSTKKTHNYYGFLNIMLLGMSYFAFQIRKIIHESRNWLTSQIKNLTFIHILPSIEYNIQLANSKRMKENCKLQRNSIIHSSLWSMIHLWMGQHSQNNHYNFKVSISKMQQIEPLLKQKCIQYLLLRKFSWIVKDLTNDLVIKLNAQLKQHYQNLMLNSFFKRTTAFEIFIVYIIKLTSHFLTDNFSNILTDFALEAQMSIILYYTFLGIEIAQKTYEIINKKYVFKNAFNADSSTSPQANQIKQKQSRASKNSSVYNPSKSSKQATKMLRFSKISDQLRFSRQSFKRFPKQTPQKETINNFTTLLRQNLHVDPLPPLKRKKANLRELQKLYTEPADVMDYSCSPIKETKDDTVIFTIKKKHLFSNQLSNSLKALHPENLLFELNSKKVKLNQSFYDTRQDKNIQYLKTDHSPQNKYVKKEENQSPASSFSKKMSSNGWGQVIKDIKKKVIQLQGSNRSAQDSKVKKKKPSMNPISQESSLNTSPYHINTPKAFADITNIQQPLRHKIVKEIDAQVSSSVLKFKRQNSKDLSGYFSIHTYQDSTQNISNPLYQLGNKNKRLLTKNSIRFNKDTFTNSCNARKSELLDVQKINLHAEWIINHYKE